MEIVPGPDFPTGGTICGRDGIVEGYKAGRGRVTLRAKVKVEEQKGGKAFQILLTWLAYRYAGRDEWKTYISGDEAKQDASFAQGHIAMIVANGWEVGVITDPKGGDPNLKDKLGAFPIPSHNAGQTAPVFLGGSDLGIAAKSKNQALANEWAPHGVNVNAPVDGLRPDPAFRNIVDVAADAASWQHQLQIDATMNPGALLPAFKGPRISWKRTTVFLNYSLANLQNNTDGPFSVAPTGDLSQERGPATDDVRQRLNFAFNNQIVRNLIVSINGNAQSAPAYSLLTGRDDNGDGIFNDRPESVSRNTLRARGQANLNVLLGYQFAFGHTAPLPPGIGVFGGGNSATVRTFDQGTMRYRLGLFVQAFNLTNHANYLGYSGTLLSPFFGKPTAARDMRKIDVGINLTF